ncbi:MAG: cation-translocating P-type ATPase [Acidobacteriota bacterium]
MNPSLEAFDEPLTEAEKRSIAVRLGPLLVGAGLLALGVIYGALRPDQMPVAALIQGLAAVTVSVSVGIRGVRGFLARPTRDLTAQLVTLAVLAAMSIGDFVTATLVPLLMELGQLFEERSSRGARAAIEGIRKLRAHRARRIDVDGESEIEVEVKPDEVRQGDVVIVRPGEIIPVDGTVVAGHSSVDQSPITGESVYAEVEPGSDVFSGTVNLGGLLRIEAAGVGGESVIGRVLSLLRQVERSKTAAIRLVERCARVYLPIIVAIAAATLFLTGETRRAIAVLIVACPSALFLAGPVAMVAATTACTRLRILIKSATFLETVADVRTLIFDKTGTVTMGSMTVHAIHTIGDATEDDVLRAAAACAQGSLHPVSRAVALEAERRDLAVERAGKVLEEPGNGVVAETDAGLCRLGRARWLASLGLAWAHDDIAKETTGAWVARGDRVLGYVALADRPRDEALEALRQTSRLGIERMILITGDREEVAASVAAELGFDEYVAEVLPERKLELVRQEQEAGRKVMMIGDGINDALALSGADVGVAVGARVNEIALGGADVALMTSDLNRLWQLMRIAQFTRTLVVQNILLVAAFSALMITLASRGIISPLTGAWLHNVDAFFVILNSARVLRFAAYFGVAQGESAEASTLSPARISAGLPTAAHPSEHGV